MVKSQCFLILAASFISIAFGCAPNYNTWFDGWCFSTKYTSYTPYQSAHDNCANDGARLPVIRTAQEQKYFVDTLKSTVGQSYPVWLGLNCTSVGQLKWEDGTSANYTNFGNSNACNPGEHYIIDTDGTWKPYFTNSIYYVACMSTHRSDSSCDDFNVNGKLCYKAFPGVKTWADAETACQADNSHLISIHDKNLDDFVRRTAVANGFMDGVHIGLHWIQTPMNGSYSWIDETDEDYVNFAPAYPNEKYGNCVAMQTSIFPGQWMNLQCLSTQLPYVCARSMEKQPVHGSTCPPTAEYFDGDDIYSPAFPKPTGPKDCNYFILANGTMRASVVVSLFESNACCDSLTILDGGFGHTVIATLKGFVAAGTRYTATSSQMRLHWNSTSGSNVRGFHVKVQSY